MTGRGIIVDSVAGRVDPAMSLVEISQLLSRMGDRYPTPETQGLARELAAALHEAYLDAMCRNFLTNPREPPHPA